MSWKIVETTNRCLTCIHEDGRICTISDDRSIPNLNAIPEWCPLSDVPDIAEKDKRIQELEGELDTLKGMFRQQVGGGPIWDITYSEILSLRESKCELEASVSEWTQNYEEMRAAFLLAADKEKELEVALRELADAAQECVTYLCDWDRCQVAIDKARKLVQS